MQIGIGSFATAPLCPSTVNSGSFGSDSATNTCVPFAPSKPTGWLLASSAARGGVPYNGGVRWVAFLFAATACGRVGFDEASRLHDGSLASNDAVSDRDVALADYNVAFVTSTTQIPGALGGLAGADAICRARAQAASLPGTFVAWLSTSTVNARDRLGSARGWLRTDGLPIADTVADLAADRLLYPIALDEFGTNGGANYEPETGSTNGTVTSGETCGDYADVNGNGMIGIAQSGSLEWETFAATVCNVELPLFCFQTDHTQPLQALTGTTRRVFESTSSWTASTGIANADSLCATEASTASLPGTFHALLATDTATAASRFALGAAAWSRVDNVVVTSDLMTSSAGIYVTADGTYRDTVDQIVVGAADPFSLGTNDCTNWTSSTTDGWVIFSPRSGAAYASVLASNCASDMHVYCLQD